MGIKLLKTASADGNLNFKKLLKKRLNIGMKRERGALSIVNVLEEHNSHALTYYACISLTAA